MRNLRLNFHCEIGELPGDAKTVDLWIPIPPTNERQTIKLLNESELTGGRFTKEKTFGNQLYYRRFDATDRKTPMKVELVYDVEVHEATVAAAKQLISTSAEVPTDEFAPYLARNDDDSDQGSDHRSGAQHQAARRRATAGRPRHL